MAASILDPFQAFSRTALAGRVRGTVWGHHFGSILGVWADSGFRARLGGRLGRLRGDLGSQNGPNLAPKMAPSWAPNRTKIDLGGFWLPTVSGKSSGATPERFWNPKWPQLEPQDGPNLEPKSHQNRCQNGSFCGYLKKFDFEGLLLDFWKENGAKLGPR